MNYDIRNISTYFKDIHSRYFADVNGVIYTSLSKNLKKIMINGKKRCLSMFISKNLSYLNSTNKMIMPIPDTDNKYYLLNDGTILQRMKTSIDKEVESVTVKLVKINNSDYPYSQLSVSRIVANCFIGDINNKEVHHIDGDRKNNKVDNLKILSFEEHRGKGNFKKNHKNI